MGYGVGELSDGHYGAGAWDIGLGTAMFAGGMAGNSAISRIDGAIASPGKAISWQESSQSLDPKAHSSIPKVTAELTDPVTGKVFTDTNQGNRPDFYLGDQSRPTLINNIIQAKIDKRPDKNYPNGDMATAHAEVGSIQQAYEQGMTQGRNMELVVSGKPVCNFCMTDIRSMAEKAGLNSLTIYEKSTGHTLYWQQGMKK
ncbi:hypothetical protein HYN51_03945 [Limnobaculum parvum]|uniref:Putative cytidine deaminase C-terminal domain-containing protein n=1 Tax=Limnobaculum parvum TaxID=2172103 RepID=A0A2Y9TW06_9GAMM|nr:hypothetical protein HYN51_03945 [Limnobaculum parvum]